MWNAKFVLLLSAAVLTTAIACGSKEESRESRGEGRRRGGEHASKVVSGKSGKGWELYKANCVACHGESGKGDGPGAGVLKPPPRDHTDRTYMSTLSDKEIGDIIRMGGAVKGKPLMPSHPQINGDNLNALVAYVRSLSEPHGSN